MSKILFGNERERISMDDRFKLSANSSVMLNLLRVILAQLVLLGHAFDFFGVFSQLNQGNAPPQIGRLAVVVFFILSGLLIAYSVDLKRERGSYTFLEYFIERFCRIYSALLPALVIIALIDLLPYDNFERDYPTDTNNWVSYMIHALHLQEYPFSNWQVLGSGLQLWSISIEWWIYMFYGLVMMGMPYRRRFWFYLLAVVSGVSILGNSIKGSGNGIAVNWFLGVFIYLSLRNRIFQDMKPAYAFSIGVFLILTGLFRVYLFSPLNYLKAYDLHFGVLAAGSLFFFILGFQKAVFRIPSFVKRAINFLADYSFTLYLTHFALLTILYEFKNTFSPVQLLFVAIISCNLFAAFFAMVTENKNRVLRTKLKGFFLKQARD